MRIEITVDYDVPAVEFEALSKVYPLGKYISSGHCHWFRLEIDSQDGMITLSWFKAWV